MVLVYRKWITDNRYGYHREQHVHSFRNFLDQPENNQFRFPDLVVKDGELVETEHGRYDTKVDRAIWFLFEKCNAPLLFDMDRPPFEPSCPYELGYYPGMFADTHLMNRDISMSSSSSEDSDDDDDDSSDNDAPRRSLKPSNHLIPKFESRSPSGSIRSNSSVSPSRNQPGKRSSKRGGTRHRISTSGDRVNCISPDCNQTNFSSISSMLEHFESVGHPKKRGIFHCAFSWCPNDWCKARGYQDAVKHLQCHQPKSVYCPGCGQPFSRKDAAKRHIYTKHHGQRVELWKKIEEQRR
ncbi:hypothetical protein C8J56DRAFT_1040807 [Mycena floridula]|nr:hypothetical protein C8J56DRAFT_1040807 [Mycena floridula]